MALARTAETGSTVIAHRELLAQALANLVDNSIKYTPEGGHVTLACRKDGDRVLVSVVDDGPGVPEAERERVMERFVRLESHRATPGSGLGLSLVRAVARLHGATFRLEDNRPGLRAIMALRTAPIAEGAA